MPAILAFILPAIASYLASHPEALPNMIAVIKSLVDTIRGAPTTPAQVKIDLDSASAAIDAAARRVAAVKLPGDV